MEFHVYTRNLGVFFYCDSGQTLPQISEVVVYALGDIQNLNGHGPGQPAPAVLALSLGTGLDDLPRCLPTSAVLWFSN